jgi:hypothetical protein
MIHRASIAFWARYDQLPRDVRALADKNFALLKADPKHPSLHFKKAGKYWSVRVGLGYRALAVEIEGGYLWGWIGTHAEYNRLLKSL